jgi:2-keto-4-pentenoate hydratase/2-oxohepta-3-ene-1,7-dioic acid hydratase in catechol pathway
MAHKDKLCQDGFFPATGTPGGVGFKRDPQVFMKVGDTVEIEISQIGVLKNTIIAE